MVVWQSYDQDGDLFGVVGQRYDRLGNARGSGFVVNTYTTGYQEFPQVAVHPAGKFVVTWDSTGGPDGLDVFARCYDAAGNPAGPEFSVTTFPGASKHQQDVAPTAGGGFVVVWLSYFQGDPDGASLAAPSTRSETRWVANSTATKARLK